ncbi:thiamine phosphate synthase [Dyadobacter alkalitolerans]|uniref:thiamine phosphate synthase n=1 Tax=Dyadobacter alkalitolerans TaxID=492736 RepID=UPI000418C01F|nr:thiamine phosphate synthase [Dyadobacter alkalitolerans]
MELIAISHPDFIPNEAERINALFRDGLQRLHLRKPACNVLDLNRLIAEINPVFYSKIALHSHHELAAQYGITRLHFPESLRKETPEFMLKKLKDAGFKLSTSVHAIDELADLSDNFEYTFFGPVFDSISKKGYSSIIGDDMYLNDEQKTVKVIAIGGIDHSNISQIQKMNFDGAALLGAIWHAPNFKFSNIAGGLSPRQIESDSKAIASDPDFKKNIAGGLSPRQMKLDLKTTASDPDFKKNIAGGLSPRQMRSDVQQIDKLQFISNQSQEFSHLESISLALEAGCRWIQLRVKNEPEKLVLEMAQAAKALCDTYGAKLIINDFPDIAKAISAHGLHLGLSDMPIPEARKIMGDNMIIGGTANTFEDILLRIDEGADYIGLGPFRFTKTKLNLSPILGLEGYRDLMQRLAEAKKEIPIIAIGGILPDDVPALLGAGLHGVAMSSALIQSKDPKETVQKLEEILC